MGTSNPYGGQHQGSLIPTWLGGGDDSSPPPPDDGNAPEDDPGQAIPKAPAERPDPVAIPSNQFSSARSDFTRFAKSGGSDSRSMGRSISKYVSSSAGGAKSAAQRMGASKVSGGNLARVLSSIRTEGLEKTLRTLNLKALAQANIEDIFIGLVDFVCPESGTIDEGIARSAFIETIADLAAADIQDLENLSAEQMQTVLEIYATNAIEARLCNDIGIKITIAPENVHAVHMAQKQLHDFIHGAVSDAFTRSSDKLNELTSERSQEFIERVYEQAFGILQTLAEREADAR